MTPDPIPLRSASTLECRNCGAGAPVDEHFCPQCNRILALGRYGDFFSFLGVPRKLGLDPQDLERRFRDLSRNFIPTTSTTRLRRSAWRASSVRRT